MKKNVIFLVIFFLFLFHLDDNSAENFEPVDLYILGSPEGGSLEFESSSGSTQAAIIAEDETTKGPNFNEVGRWDTGTLSTQANISGEWSASAWVYSSRAVTITLRYSIIQNDETLDSFEFGGDVNAEETVELTSGDQDFSLSGIETSPITLLIESSWNDQPGPPPTSNVTINLEYGSSARATHVQLPISHLQITLGQELLVRESQKEVTVYVNVYDIFGVGDVLSLSENDYSLEMGPDQGPEAGSLWSANVTKATNKNNDYVEVQLVWFYGGHSLPAETNSYSLEFMAEDLLSSSSWSKSLSVDIYITPVPDIEISASSSKKTVDFGKEGNYKLTFENTGSGFGEFEVDYDNEDGWIVNLSVDEFDLDVGESQEVTVSISVPSSTSDGQKSSTVITVSEENKPSITDSITVETTAREPAPDWDFSIEVDYASSDAFDSDLSLFVIKDRATIEVSFELTNEGNEQNNFNVEALSQDSAFTFSFNPNFVSLSPGESAVIDLAISPKADYFGTSNYVEIVATSSGDQTQESETISIELQQSGSINLRDSNLQIKNSQGASSTHLFQVSNSDLIDSKQIYFEVSGIDSLDQLAEDWISFKDKNGREISDTSYLPLYPSQTVEITMFVNMPKDADLGSYNLEISMHNEQKVRISNVYQFRVVSLESSETEESNLTLYAALLGILGVVGFGIYRNLSNNGYNEYDDFDDYEDFDDLEEMPELFDEQPLVSEPVVQAVEPVVTPVAAEPAVAPVTTDPVVAAPVVAESSVDSIPTKPKKKWFGLFGGSKTEEVQEVAPVSAAPVSAAPVVAAPVSAAPVSAAPVVAAPVVAEPVAAAPVVAEPVAADPVVEPIVADPVVAAPVSADPVVAAPVVAEPVVAAPVVAAPVVAEPVLAEPVVAQSVEAEPVVAQAIVVPEEENQ